MTSLIVLLDGKRTVALAPPEGTEAMVLNHVAQLATFLARDIEIHAFGADGAKWKMRGQR